MQSAPAFSAFCRMLPALLLAGCVDLSAVSNFAKTSSQITASEPVISGWSASFDEAHQVALSPELRHVVPHQARTLEVARAQAQKYAPMAQKAAQTLALYMQALAQLSDSKLPNLSSQATMLDASLQALKIEKTNGAGLEAKGAAGSLLQLLSIPIDFWRQYTVRELILRADNDVQILAEFLSVTADTVETAEAAAGQTVARYYQVSARSTHDAGVRALLRNVLWEHQAAMTASRAKAHQAAQAFATIGKDHAALARNANRLSGVAVQSTLATDAPLLQAALKVLVKR